MWKLISGVNAKVPVIYTLFPIDEAQLISMSTKIFSIVGGRGRGAGNRVITHGKHPSSAGEEHCQPLEEPSRTCDGTGKLLGQPEGKQWQKRRKNWCVLNTALQHWGELRLIKFPWFLGRITLGKHLWCCVLPRAVWTQLPLLSDSQGLCGLQDSTATLKVDKKRSSDLPTATTCPGSTTSPATAAHNTHLCSTAGWLGQPRLSGTHWHQVPVPSQSPGKANQDFPGEGRQRHGGGMEVEALTQSTVFSWAPSASPSTSAWCNKLSTQVPLTLPKSSSPSPIY